MDGTTPPATVGRHRIPVRNLWLLLLYASDLYRNGPEGFDGIEDYPHQLPDLLAEILLESVRLRLRQALTPEFRGKSADLKRVRGRLDLLRTESRQLLSRGTIACVYEELTVDTPRNRFIHHALTTVASLVSDKELAHDCRQQAGALVQRGVSPVYSAKDKSNRSGTRLTKADARDKRMLLAARLALDLSLPASSAASGGLGRADFTDAGLRRLFEQGVGGFYAAVLRGRGWTVQTGPSIRWNHEALTPAVDAFLPAMSAGIRLEHPGLGRRIFLDTSFTPATAPGATGRETLRKNDLYRIYTHVRTQESAADPLSLACEGILLYPEAGAGLHEGFASGGHRFTAATVDLAGEAVAIRERLLALVEAPGA